MWSTPVPVPLIPRRFASAATLPRRRPGRCHGAIAGALGAASLLTLTTPAAAGAAFASPVPIAVPAQVAPVGVPPAAPVMVIGHRGASGYRPEHTFPAYDLAVTQDADMIECDLQLTHDEVLVCVHDTTVDRTSAASGRVDSFTLAELRQQEFGSWYGPAYAGAAIVPFEEQLRCYGALNPNLRFHVETKAPSEYGGRMEPILLALLDRLGLIPTGPADPVAGRVVIQSFELRSLEVVRSMAPSLPTAWLLGTPVPEVLPGGTLPASVDILAPTYQVVLADPSFVTRMHLAGRLVQVYTVNDVPTMDLLLDAGIDGAFTNVPDLLRAEVDARGTGVPAAVRGTRPRSRPAAPAWPAPSPPGPIRSPSSPKRRLPPSSSCSGRRSQPSPWPPPGSGAIGACREPQADRRQPPGPDRLCRLRRLRRARRRRCLAGGRCASRMHASGPPLLRHDHDT